MVSIFAWMAAGKWRVHPSSPLTMPLNCELYGAKLDDFKAGKYIFFSEVQPLNTLRKTLLALVRLDNDGKLNDDKAVHPLNVPENGAPLISSNEVKSTLFNDVQSLNAWEKA